MLACISPLLTIAAFIGAVCTAIVVAAILIAAVNTARKD